MKRLLLAALLLPLPAMAANTVLYAGSYTAGISKGIYAWRFDSKSGALSSLGLVAQSPQAAHIWIAPSGKTLYTVNWETDGGVSAYAINHKTGALTFLNKTSAHGAQPNQVVVDPGGSIAVTVTYAGGSLAAYKLEPDGKLGEAFYVDHHTGKPLSPKQPGPKQHGIQFSRDDKFMFITDLGLDRVYTYHVDVKVPSITPADPPYVSTHAGAGPRRIQMSPDGRFLYVDHETDSEVSAFAIDGGKLKEIQTLPTVPDDAKAHNTTAEIIISADGHYLYVSNRGHDSVAIFAIDKKTGLLTAQGNAPTGKTPRNIRIDPTGHWLFAANENGGTIIEYERDPATGSLRPTDVFVRIDTPGGMYFLKQ